MTTNSPESGASAAQDTAVSMQRPIIISVLYLANFVLGFSVFIGLILAYIWRGEDRTGPWEQSHYTYLIRTFWIGAAVCVAFIVLAVLVAAVGVWTERGGADPDVINGFGILAMFVAIGLMALLGLWYGVRSILSLVRAADRQPMHNPKAWLF